MYLEVDNNNTEDLDNISLASASGVNSNIGQKPPNVERSSSTTGREKFGKRRKKAAETNIEEEEKDLMKNL